MPGGEHIGGPQLVGEPVQVAFIIPARSLADHNLLGPEFVDDRLELARHRVQGLVPGDPLPPLAGLFHGMKDTVRVISELGNGKPLAAQGTVTDRGIRIPFHLDHFAVHHMGDDPASPVAAPAGRSNFFEFTHCMPPYASTISATSEIPNFRL